MKVRCPVCVKHIGMALGMLIVLLLSLEAGLRLHEGRSQPAPGESVAVSPLVECSSQCFHRLRPLLRVQVRHPDTGEMVLLKTNSLGLRGEEVEVPKPGSVYRVLLLGDDSTLAPETPEEATTAQQLQRILRTSTARKVEVINAGMPSYCPLLSYLLLKHCLLPLQPDLIVLSFDMSDVADDHRFRRYVQVGEDGEPLVCVNPALDGSDASRPHRVGRWLLLEWARRQVGRLSTRGTSHSEAEDIDSPLGQYAWVKDSPPDWSVYVMQTFQSLRSLKRLAESISSRLIVAAVPAPWQISADASNTPQARTSLGIPLGVMYRSRRPFERLGEFLRENRIVYCNPVLAFQSSPEAGQLFLRRVPRFSPQGNRLFARELARTILATVPELSRRGAPEGTDASSAPARSASARRFPATRPNTTFDGATWRRRPR